MSTKREANRQSDTRAAKEILLLWAVLIEGGLNEVSRSILNERGMLPSDDKEVRDGLKARGLITVENRTTRNKNGRPVRGYWMQATEAGRAWAEENLAAMPARSQAAAPILQAWLARLSIFLHAQHTSIGRFLEQRAIREPDSKAEITPPVTVDARETFLAQHDNAVRTRIRQAYFELTGGRLNARALLSKLREKLKDIDRSTLDEVLKRMQSDEEASLYQLDNQVEVTDADRAAAIYFGGEPRHIVWIER